MGKNNFVGSVKLVDKQILEKCTHWLGPGLKIGQNEKLTNLTELKENIS